MVHIQWYSSIKRNSFESVLTRWMNIMPIIESEVSQKKKTQSQISYILMHIYGIQVGDGNGKPLQYSCLENPVDRGAWWAAVHRVAQSRTQLKRLSKHAHIGEGNGNPLQCSCLRNPRDRGAWWAAVYRVAGSDTTKAAQQQHGTQKDGTDESIYRTEMEMQTQRTDLWTGGKREGSM